MSGLCYCSAENSTKYFTYAIGRCCVLDLDFGMKSAIEVFHTVKIIMDLRGVYVSLVSFCVRNLSPWQTSPNGQ